MSRRLRRQPEEDVIDVSEEWWAAVERDGHQCRVAPFLPDRPCSGSLTVYDPGAIDDPEPAADDAVTVCDGHYAWLIRNGPTAKDLGLIRTSL